MASPIPGRRRQIRHQSFCIRQGAVEVNPDDEMEIYDKGQGDRKVATSADTTSPNFLHRNHGFSSNQVKPLYFYGYYLVISRPISWNDLTNKLTQELMSSQEAFPDGILSTTDLQSSIPELPPKKLWGDLQCAAWNFHHNMPNPEISQPIMSYHTITYIGDLRQY